MAINKTVYLPWTTTTQVSWTVASMRAALNSHETGDFSTSAKLIDAMGRDDRLAAVLDTRVRGLLSRPISFVPPAGHEEDKRALAIAEALEESWSTMAPESELAALMRWRLMAGLGIAELRWETEANVWTPRLYAWNLQWARIDTQTGDYVLQTQTGDVVVKPGEGKWLLASDGAEGYMRGLVRSTALSYLVRQFALRDWARYSERHGLPIVKALVPASTQAEEREDFFEDVRSLSTDTTVQLPIGVDERGTSFGLELLEASDGSWEGFERLITSCNVSMAIAVLGQNLTTEVQGGSYAAAKSQELVRQDYARADAEVMSTVLREQLIKPWVAANYAGAEELTPWAQWTIAEPEDMAAKATTMQAVIQSLDNAERVGAYIDTAAVLESYGIPMRELTEQQAQSAQAKVFEYHLKYGTMTVNEVRQQLGLKPVSGGNVLIAPQTVATLREEPQAVAMRDASAATKGQEYVDRVEAAGRREYSDAIAPNMERVLALMDASDSFAELENRLRAAYAAMKPDALARTLEKASVLAKLAGRWSVQEDL